MNYTTEMGPKLTQWVINKIKRDYPDDVALLIGMEHCSPDGSGTRRYYAERNQEIRQKYRQGINPGSPEEQKSSGAVIDSLAQEYGLSEERVRKIIYG